MKIQKFNLPAINPYKTNQLKAEQSEQKAKMKTDKLEISSEAKHFRKLLHLQWNAMSVSKN